MEHKANKPKHPPLSFCDGLIYAVWFVSVMALALAVMLGYSPIQKAIVQQDTAAMMWRDTAWAWMIAPVVGCLGLLILVSVWYPLPFFGNPKVRYGQFPYHAYAPLFSKTRPYREARPQEYAVKRRESRILLAAVLAAFLLGLPGLCPRWTLQTDHTLRHYDARNRCIETVPAADITAMHIIARHGNSRSGVYWDYFIRLDTRADGSQSFYHHQFAVNEADGLRFLIALRDSLGVPVSIEARDRWDANATAAELLPKIAEDLEYGSEETALLYELFEA